MMKLFGGDVDGVGDGTCCCVVEVSLGGGMVDRWSWGSDMDIVVIGIMTGFRRQTKELMIVSIEGWEVLMCGYCKVIKVVIWNPLREPLIVVNKSMILFDNM